MLRPLLLLALLLRLAPAPGMAASHCAPEPAAVAAEGAAHAHHGQPAGGGDQDHEECTHCPPSECARHAACEVAPAVACVESAGHAAFAPLVGQLGHAPPAAWTTAHAAPPTRPPASSLA